MTTIVGPIHLKAHPHDEKLMIGEIAGHQVVIGNHYDDETLGFFIPDGAIIPDKLAEEMWLKGKLAGGKKNRVKARDIKGTFSEGLFYGSRYWILDGETKKYIDSPSWNPKWAVGECVDTEVGITYLSENREGIIMFPKGIER